jgi:hypothetical protein
MSERHIVVRPGSHSANRGDDRAVSGAETAHDQSLEHSTGNPGTGFQRVQTLEDLIRADGPPLSTRELARLIGMSATFIRSEIRAGHLRGVAIGRGRKRVFRITAREARRYAKTLGLI